LVDQAREFAEIQERVYSTYADGRYEEVLSLAEEAARAFPEERWRTTYWIASMQSLLGRSDEAIATLRHGFAEGLYWPPEALLRERDFAPIRDLPAFRSLVEQCRIRWDEAQQDAEPQLRIASPRSEPRAILVALHMAGSQLDREWGHWQSAVESGVALVALQSSQADPLSGGFSWRDRSKVAEDLNWALQRAHPQFAGVQSVLVGGASEGGAVAIESALTAKPHEFTGFIGVVPSSANFDDFDSTVKEASIRGVRGYILTGEKDFGRAHLEEFHGRLSGEIACSLVVEPGQGHVYPHEFSQRLAEAIDFVLR
jgi:hypothetical protein